MTLTHLYLPSRIKIDMISSRQNIIMLDKSIVTSKRLTVTILLEMVIVPENWSIYHNIVTVCDNMQYIENRFLRISTKYGCSAAIIMYNSF